MSPPSEVTHGFGVFPHRGLTLTRGQGTTVWDDQDRAYLDAGGASYGTMNVGHAHPRVVEAIEQASQGLTHTSQVFAHPARSQLTEALLDLAGPWAGRVFLSNSGTEAIEAAIKTAVATTGRSELVAFEGGFHGRSLGALAATHRPSYRAPFQERLGATRFTPWGDLEALAGQLDEDVAAVLLEPVQGEAGVRPAPDGFLEAVVDLAREAGALVILDEVQTGLGRTGHDLALHGAGVKPDLVCLAKSLAAGLPLGATIAHERIDPLGKGQHGTTFGGSPVACQAALAVLGILDDEGLAHQAQAQGQRLHEGLAGIDSGLIRQVRSQGLMVGVELGVRATPVLKALQTDGVLALPAGDNVLRFLPPLTLDDEGVDRLVGATEDALATVQARYARGARP